jgi:CDP-4-dehydro-6-deoxyglucose reductase, E1
MKIPLAINGLRKNDIDAVYRTISTGQLTMGQKVKEFENSMSKYLNVKHFVMVNSGSSANLAVIEALLRPSIGPALLKAGDLVLVPSVAWPTTIWPLAQLGLKPVFVDVEPETLAIDLKLAQKIVDGDEKIKAIFAIHPLGYAIDDQILDEFCRRNNLIQINDVCESLGSWRNKTHAGTSGIASTYSFYFSHHITTMEGGGIATNSDALADDLRAIRSHGWSRDRSDVEEWRKDIGSMESKFQFITTGFNIRPMEIQAAIGIEQIKDLNNFVNRRIKIANKVAKSLKGTKLEIIDAGFFQESSNARFHSWMLIPIRINKDLQEGEKARFIKSLEEKGIESRPVLTGNFIRQPAIRKLYPEIHPEMFPVAERVSSNYFMVGCHHELTDVQVEYLCESLNSLALTVK